MVKIEASVTNGWRILLMLVGVLALMQPATSIAADVEPGPEEGGLRLRWIVSPNEKSDKPGYDVKVDLINASSKAITLKTGWKDDEKGDVKEYLEAAASVECKPAIEPWRGGTAARFRDSEPVARTLELKAGETLSINWTSRGNQLKNRVNNPHDAQNPTFPLPGLYAAHLYLNVIMDERTVRLRSNEQLVSVGGSRAMPKHTYGTLSHVSGEKKRASLGMGANQKVAVGDRFAVTSKQYAWILTITDVQERHSEGTLTPYDGAEAKQPLPHVSAAATLETK